MKCTKCKVENCINCTSDYNKCENCDVGMLPTEIEGKTYCYKCAIDGCEAEYPNTSDISKC